MVLSLSSVLMQWCCHNVQCCPNVQYFVSDIVTNSHYVQYSPGVQYYLSGVVPTFRVVPVGVSVVLAGQFCTDGQR